MGKQRLKIVVSERLAVKAKRGLTAVKVGFEVTRLAEHCTREEIEYIVPGISELKIR